MILITGASSGLGAALAKCYAEETQQVVISARNAARLNLVAATLNQRVLGQQVQDQGAQAVRAMSADLTSETSVIALFDQLQQAETDSSPLNTVIHCAGSGYFGNIDTQEADSIANLIQNNVTSAILLVRELVKRYRNQAVNVVIVMSTAALAAKAGESTYCAAKWAVRGFIESVRLELKGYPMKIIAVYPGGMDTQFWPTSGKALDTSTFMSADEAAIMLKQALIATEHGYIADITINRG
ncbi:SDR family NAD(P)-dependent oxidoreductase [Shewanella sp. OMA3-2]|uniref:SDR family NAD(P)-dependent oxidoreductase n=1 Tax=Shewanella sp. OMA3-2 TaxID=2908650 RepID=UPI001F4557BF|nr:SDR family NAD(P)-dependent oxidoreductase [Shewanella sp. OMA3-2]UJF22573.1 SDR family NAD(P)-dependent oxidoreductase [Shewanella sp. OMA3-2]